MRSYESLNAFYGADRRRLRSRERDVGLYWRGDDGETFRAAWVQETGEVYLFRHGLGTVHVLSRRFGLGELMEALGGYHDVCGREASLTWFIYRTADVAVAA
jgi:hypothetical protein